MYLLALPQGGRKLIIYDAVILLVGIRWDWMWKSQLCIQNVFAEFVIKPLREGSK